MRAPNQIIPKVILLYTCKHVGLRLTLKNIFLFLILGNEDRKFSLISPEGEGEAEVRRYSLQL